jgi:hypothetical protein
MEDTNKMDPPYLRFGILAGVLGALVVAVFFLVVDVAAGRPLATPTALGATLFQGKPFDLSQPPSAPLIVGYTAVHGVVFVGLASITATLLLGARRSLGSRAAITAILTAVFFAASSALFFGFTVLWELPEIRGDLSAWRVLVANLLASLAMAVPLAQVRPWRVPSGGEARRESTRHPANSTT